MQYEWARIETSGHIEPLATGWNDGMHVNGGVLNITRANRNDAGLYLIKATNERGSSNMTVRVQVNCVLSRLLEEYSLIGPLSQTRPQS